MAAYKRSRFFVDTKVQGALVLRTFAYWWMCLLTLTIWLVGWRVLTEPADFFVAHIAAVWSQFGLAAIFSILLLPIVVIDIVRLSNRFAGPMYRLRREVRRILEGETVGEIKLRDGDYWQDFAADLSQVLAKYQALRATNEPVTPVTDKSTAPQDASPTATAV